MKLLLGFGVFALIVWAGVTPWHREHNPQFNDQGLLETFVELGRPSVPVRQTHNKSHAGVMGGVAQSWSHLASRTDLGISDPERDLIMDLQEESGVPGWVLYGIWRNESNCLSGGWYENRPWRQAREAALNPASRCRRVRGGRCLEAWDALRSICSQTRSDGSRVCDPNQVWTSYTLAMGPMQQMPRPFVIGRDGGWKDYITDYDGDGVYDPHSLPDAMATAAAVLRNGTITRGSLRAAVQAYAGNTPHDHYAKLRRDYRPDWCRVGGYCTD